MLKFILEALCSYDNGAEAKDVMYYVRGLSLKATPIEEIREQLDFLVKAHVLMMNGERYQFRYRISQDD